jgi:hypothetical protein
MFVFIREEDGAAAPPGLADWRELHARCMYEQRFFEE